MIEKKGFVEQRRPWWARLGSDLLYRNGRAEIAKFGEVAGYALTVALIWKHHAALVGQPWSLAMLLMLLVAPSVFKKLVASKLGGTK